jgi:hypothetical protein
MTPAHALACKVAKSQPFSISDLSDHAFVYAKQNTTLEEAVPLVSLQSAQPLTLA